MSKITNYNKIFKMQFKIIRNLLMIIKCYSKIWWYKYINKGWKLIKIKLTYSRTFWNQSIIIIKLEFMLRL